MKGAARSKRVFLSILFGLVLLGQATNAQAWGWGRNDGRQRRHEDRSRNYRYHHQYPIGRAEVVLPGGYISISVRGNKYFYSGGFFYRPEPRGYVVVPAPVDAVIYTIPAGCHRLIIDGVTYYSYEGVYYQRVSGGYRVVEPPTTVIVDPATVAVNHTPEQVPDSFTVNIPNKNGGYTTVLLKRSGGGFTGPQGEFYPEFPKVEQLRTMYAR